MVAITGLAFLMAASSFPGEVAVAAAPQAELQLGYRLKGRVVEPLPSDAVLREGDAVVAWTAISGVSSGFVEHVWYRDEIEVARHYLPVGAGRRWRTWSRHRLAGGEYQLQVLAPDGKVLAESRFTVEADGC